MPSDVTDLPIADAAHEVVDLERSTPLDGEFDITLGDSFTDPHLRAHFARQERTGAIRLYRLRDVTLDASLMLLLRGRSRISDTRYLVTDQEYAHTLVKPLSAIPLDPAEHYVIGCNRAWHNYYHWLVQSLPTIDLGLRLNTHRKLTLVLSSLRPWQEESLALLRLPGHSAGRRCRYPTPSCCPVRNSATCWASTRRRMVSRAAMTTFRRLSQAVPWPYGAADEIYVARTDAHNRVALNEPELIELLERQGVRIVVPSTLSVAEQIAAFRAARLVIGPHGVGLSNIVFCQKRQLRLRAAAAPLSRTPRSIGSRRRRVLTTGPICSTALRKAMCTPAPGGSTSTSSRSDWTRSGRVSPVRRRQESAIQFLKRTQVAHPDEAARAGPCAGGGPGRDRRSRRAAPGGSRGCSRAAADDSGGAIAGMATAAVHGSAALVSPLGPRTMTCASGQ